MRVCVFGLWHLGSVTAACVASKGHEVIGLDYDKNTVAQLSLGKPPLFEPGLPELVEKGLGDGSLRFTTDAQEALKDCDVVWVTFDTPVDAHDVADVESVVGHVSGIFNLIPDRCTVIVSSQVPVGTTQRLQSEFTSRFPGKTVWFACSPENLRLGSSIKVFTEPDRIVVGVDSTEAKAALLKLFAPISLKLEWMSVASAEMVKHATNAFLATSVSFINEIATLCEYTGADAKEVERGLKSEARIGPKAYLGPGSAFAGGTLARDIMYLSSIAESYRFPAHLLRSVAISNSNHKDWMYRRLKDSLGDLNGLRVCIWGLTYKPGTDTLRRSSSVELCKRIAAEGAQVIGFDPAVKVLPEELSGVISLGSTPLDAARGAHAIAISTEWPEFREVSMQQVAAVMSNVMVLDPNRSLFNQWSGIEGVRYLSVGRGA
jgi:UDPglucose 6-dehydrogenase